MQIFGCGPLRSPETSTVLRELAQICHIPGPTGTKRNKRGRVRVLRAQVESSALMASATPPPACEVAVSTCVAAARTTGGA